MEKKKIVFFEVDEKEQEYFDDKLGGKAELVFYSHRLTPDVVDEAARANYITTFIYSDLSHKTIEHIRGLEGIVTMSAGTDHIDLGEAASRKIKVANIPAYGPNTVAQHALALLLALSRKIVPSVERTKKGVYEYAGLTGWDLKGRTLGIIGTGKIGATVARMAKGFDLRLVAYDPFPNKKLTEELGIEYMTLNQVLHTADIITLHVPLTKETKNLLGHEEFQQMKPGMVIINTARGALIDPDALLDALDKEIVSEAGIDVLDDEGLLKEEKQFFSKYFKLEDYQTAMAEHALMRHPKVLITPHNAFNSKEALQNIMLTTVENLEGMLSGDYMNIVEKR